MNERDLFSDYPTTWILVRCTKCDAWSSHPETEDLDQAVCEKCLEDASPQEES